MTHVDTILELRDQLLMLDESEANLEKWRKDWPRGGRMSKQFDLQQERIDRRRILIRSVIFDIAMTN